MEIEFGKVKSEQENWGKWNVVMFLLPDLLNVTSVALSQFDDQNPDDVQQKHKI